MRTGNIMIGAVKSGKIRFDGKRVFWQDSKGDEMIAYISSYMTLTSNPGLSKEVEKKYNAWAKRKGFKINEGIGAVKSSFKPGDKVTISKSNVNTRARTGVILVSIYPDKELVKTRQGRFYMDRSYLTKRS
jgi:hypothetical protein